MARRARAAAADADHMDMGDDAKPRGDEGDAEVTDEDADFSPTHNHTVSGQGTRLPPVTGRQVPRTPPQVRRQGGPSHHNIATPASPRQRSEIAEDAVGPTLGRAAEFRSYVGRSYGRNHLQ